MRLACSWGLGSSMPCHAILPLHLLRSSRLHFFELNNLMTMKGLWQTQLLSVKLNGSHQIIHGIQIHDLDWMIQGNGVPLKVNKVF